jgi:hypothetical protein
VLHPSTAYGERSNLGRPSTRHYVVIALRRRRRREER